VTVTSPHGDENDHVQDLTVNTAPPVAVVTGANSGIGLAAAQELARRGWVVALVGRDGPRLASAADVVREQGGPGVQHFQCDFAVLDEVRALAARLRQTFPRIDLLANNAGGQFPKRNTTVDGFEKTIQVNHLAHFLLSHELREVVRGGRIVNTSSGAHNGGSLDADDLSSSRQTYRALGIYGSAKQANILFAAEAARRWPDIVSTSYHPGLVRTRFGRDSPMMALFYRAAPMLRTPAKGAETLVWLATADQGQVRSGAFYIDRRERHPASKATDPALAARLWEASLTAVGLARA
jgi:NAD(P)-dependent dehydrogenase (short-subunit alcohol dehydrogenase family)